MADEKVLKVDLNIVSKEFGSLIEKAKGGTVPAETRRTSFANINNSLIELKKSVDRLQKTFERQSRATGAPAGSVGAAQAKEDKAREKSVKAIENYTGKVQKSGTWIQRSTEKAGKEIEKSGKTAAKKLEKATDEQVKTTERATWKQRQNVKGMEGAADEMKKTGKKLQEAGKQAEDTSKEMRKAGEEAKNAAESWKKAVQEMKGLPEEQKKAVVQPFRTPKIDQRMAEIDKMMARFGNSLSSLLESIEKQARETARRSRGGLEVLGTPGRGFRGTEREFKLEIVDIKALVKEINKVSERIGETFEKRPGAKAEDLFGELRTRIARELRLELPGYEKQAAEVAKIMSREMGKVVKAAELMKDKVKLEELFDEKVIQAEFTKLRREIIKTLSIPRVQLTERGQPVIEGRTGAQKGVVRFAEFESGLDRLLKATESNLKDIANAQKRSVKEVREEFNELKVAIVSEITQEGGARSAQISDLFQQLLRVASQAGGPTAGLVRTGAARAIATGEARRAGGVSATDFEKRVKQLEQLDIGKLAQQFDSLSKDLGISTQDIIKSLDKLDFQNIYDRILDNLQAEDARGQSAMRKFFRNLEQGYTSALRDFERGIGNVTDLLPQVAPNLPKAGVAARETVAVVTAPPKQVFEGPRGPYVEERAQRQYQPEFAQREIIELNQRLKSYFNDLAITGRLIDQEVQQLSTLGMSESVGAAIDRLSEVNKVLFKMSSLDLTKLTPFGEQFANAARQMSQTMRALGGPGAEFPRLRTTTEQGLIQQGAFGQQGFGYNIVTELRHTADTFEDQVEIGGKLTKAITETVRKIVVPAGTIPEELTAEKIDKVGNEIIKLLGERREVKFSADETFVKEIRKASTVVTGQDVDVQIAKIAEKFFAQFGRKITTRGSTKGLATFPLGEAAAGGAGLRLGAEDLGIAKLPKTMGELAAEVIEQALGPDAEQELKSNLVAAGNKFFIDVFSGAESVLGEEQGRELQAILENLNRALGTSFKASVEGVEQFKKFYMESLGEAAKVFKDVPIEARISLRGVAKRGVQSEILETLANNLTGAVETVIPDRVEVEKWVGQQGVFERYLEALGFIREANEQVAAASQVIEKGKQRTGIVGEKFLQVVEEPHLKGGFSQEDVEAGVKGLRINLQAFAALTSIFGEQSAYIKEISDASRVASDEARELITSMLLMGSKMDELKPQLASMLEVVDVGDVRVFEKASGSFEEMKGTILDLEKYAKSFILSFPEAVGGGALLVPGAAARKTYPEELTGGRGPIGLARKLDLVVDAAQKALEVAGGFGKGQELLSSEEVVRNFQSAIDRWINRIEEEAKKGTPSEKAIRESFKELIKFLGPIRPGQEALVPALFTPYRARGRDKELPLTEAETVRRTLGRRIGVGGGIEDIAETPFKDIPRKAQTIAKIYADVGRLIRDIVVGSETWGEEVEVVTKLLERMRSTGQQVITPDLLAGLVPKPEEFAAKLLKEKANWEIFAEQELDVSFLEAKLKKQTERAEFTPKVQQILESQTEDAEKALRNFAAKTKVEVEKFSEESLKRATERLARARTSYSEELGRSLLGKGGAVDVGIFQRQVPAARGQVVNLKVDKIPELEAALAKLEELDAGTGRLSENIEGLRGVIEEQKKLRTEAAAEGRPFLREGEVLIPPDKAKLLGEQAAEALGQGMDLFVQTVRFPVTGAPSFQPARARLTPPEMAGVAPTAIGLPGRAPLDIDEVARFIEPLNEQLNQTRMSLDELDNQVQAGQMTHEQAATKRAELVSELEMLKNIIQSTTTRFAPFEQNLDFDGDAIFVHAAATKEAADEIRRHYESLRGMDKDIFAVRQAIFNVVNAIKEKDIAKLADVAGIFAKQFPEEKGFEFLRRPGPRAGEDLSREEILTAIQSYLGEDTGRIIAEKIGKAVSEATEEELRNYLTDLKLAEDIVKLVGHKIGIGQVTENMNRIARAAEVVVGMGGGLAGGGQPPMGGFGERWRPGIALGEDPAREFQFRLNELLRFGINSAFKTKHGGGSIYEELVAVLTTQGGFEQLQKEIASGSGPFGDLANINREIEATVIDRLRGFSLDALKKEAQNLGVAIEGDREAVTKAIVEKVNLVGFVKELYNVLYDAAIEAQKVQITKEIETGALGFPTGIPETAIQTLAEQRVGGKIAETGGINIREDITDILQPLYQLRTSAADVDTIFKRFGDVYEQNIPRWAKETEEITERMTKVKTMSDHLAQSMQDVATGLTASGDAVTLMMQSYAKQLSDVIRVQKQFAEQLRIPTAPGEDVDVKNVLGRFLAGKGLTGDVAPGLIRETMSGTLESLGLRDIPKELKDAIREEVADIARKDIEAGKEVTDEQIALVSTIKIAEAQMKRIIDELQTVSFKEAIAREVFPGMKQFIGGGVGARRGVEYFAPQEVPGGFPADPEETKKALEKQLEELKAIRDAADASEKVVSESGEKVRRSWKDVGEGTKKVMDTIVSDISDADKEATDFATALQKDWKEWTEEADREFAEERRKADEKLKKSLFDPSTGRLYDPEEVESLSPAARQRMTQAISESFGKLGDQTAAQVEEEVTDATEEMKKTASESIGTWTSRMKSAAQAAAAGGGAAGGGGDGGDDGDDFKKRLDELNRAWQKAANIPNVEERVKKLEEVTKKLEELRASIAEADPANRILESVQASINAISTLKAFADPEAGLRAAKQAAAMQDPIPTEDVITNLRLLQDIAQQTHNLYDDLWQVPEYVKEILEKIRVEGARRQDVEAFREALQQADVKGLAEQEAWKRYHLAKVEYHIRSAEQFRQLSVEAEDLAKTSEFARRAGTSAAQAQKSIIGSYRGASPFLTTQPGARGAARGRSVDPGLAEAAGVIVDPRIIKAQASEYAKLRNELEPILDMLTEIDEEKMRGPLSKARKAFIDLTMAAQDSGEAMTGALDLSTIAGDITSLRGALEEFMFRNISASEIQRQNLKDTLFFLKDLEKQYSRLGQEFVSGGLLKVPKWLQPDIQRELHGRNLEILRKGLAETVSDKGPEGLERVGTRLNYVYKVFDEGGNVIDNYVFKFKKLGDAFTSAGMPIGRFTEQMEDMNKQFQARQGLGQAFRRVIAWGGAAAVVYGTVQALQDMVNTIADVETAMVQLRKVMNPVVTDFEMIQDAGVEMAKNFGVPIQNVIESMRVFAQQGLRQAEVLDRARTSTLAANVTVLSAQDATEALTSATKQFSDEGAGSIRFLDSWIEVAARHAITSKDLALAMQRAGSAAKNAGIDFNELNAIVTGIGVTTRQTGREIGTSIRFMARRLTAAKAPAELAKVGVQAFLPTGEVRRAFDIFDELAMKWDDLTQAQRLNISMAIGGRRHYNSVLVLMKNWDETLEALTHSQNSAGSAMRRNLIVMDTFNKKVEQLRQSVIETQLAFGKFALPVAKGLVDSIRFITERLAEVPDSIKIATLSMGGLLLLANKGAGVIDRMADAWSSLTGVANIGFTGAGQKFAGTIGTALEGVTTAKSIYEVNSALGKLAFIIVDVGRSYNAFLGNLAGSVAIWNILKVATLSAITAFTGGAAALTGFTRVSSAVTIPAMTTLSLLFKSLSKEGTGLIGSLGPLALTMVGLYNVMKPLVKGFLDANKTAADFAEERQNEVLQLQENIKVMNELGFSINKLSKAQREFETGQAQITGATFVKNMESIRRQVGDLVSAQIPGAVKKFDEFGYAVLEGTSTLFEFAAGIKDVNEAALELEIGEQLSRFNKELTAAKEGMEETKFQLRELIKDLPIFGDSIARNIHVAPIIDLRESIKTVNDLLAQRAQFPLTGVFEDLYQEARENMLKARKTVEESLDGMQKAFSKLPRGATTEEFVRTLRKYREELETLADFRGAEIGLDVDPEDILAIKAFERAGIRIEAFGELTHDAFIEAGKKAKRAFSQVKADFEKEGKNIADAVAEGLDPAEWQFRSGDIVLFAKEYADQFGIAAGAALLDMRDTADGMSQAVIKFVDSATMEWTTIDFSDRIQQLVMSVFSPSGFKEAVAEGVDAANKILAGAAAGIKYPTPIDLGARFFSQVGTPEQLATGFGRRFGTPIGQTQFGRAGAPGLEFKETFEVDYKRFRKTLIEYEKLVEEVNKISQDGKIVEAALARELSNEISHLQRVIMNETAIANFRAVVIDLGKAFEEADRSLKAAIQSEKDRTDLLRRPAGLFAGLPQNIARLPQLTATLDEAALEDVAFASSERFRELISAYTEQNLTMDALVKRVTDLNQAQADLTYLKDLYEANEALVSEIDFDRFVKDVAATGNKVAALQINAIKGTGDTLKEIRDIQNEQVRILKGEGPVREFDVEKMEKALAEGGGYVGAAIAGAAARREGAFGDPIADIQFSAEEQKKAAEVFAYAAEKLSDLPIQDILREYKAALREVGIGAKGEALVPRGFDVQGTAITRLFASALGRAIGPKAFGDRFLKFASRIEQERKAEGPQLIELPADVLLPFDDMIKQQVVTVDQLKELFAVDVKAAANMDKLITQLGTFLLAFATRRGSQVAGAALGFGPGARIGEAIGIGRLGGGALGSFLGIQLADLGEDLAEQRERIIEQLEKNADVIQRAVSPARPEGQRIEGFDALLSESQIQTEFLKKIAEEAGDTSDLKKTYDLLVKNRAEYATRQDIFSILKSVAATTGVAALAGLAGGPIERAALGQRTTDLATRQFEAALTFLLDNIEIIEKLAPEIGTDTAAAVEKFKAAVKDPATYAESEIRDAFGVFEEMFQLISKETGATRQQVIDLLKEQKLTQLELAMIAFQKKLGQQLLQIANSFKGDDLARSVRNEYEAALTGFLKGLRFPGAIEPGRPAIQATAEERVFAADPGLYEGFVAGQERLQALSGTIQELARQMAVLDTQIKSGQGDTKYAAAQYEALSQQQEILAGTADRLQDSLGRMKETLDQAIVVERLRVSVQGMLTGLKKFNDVIKEIDTTSIEMARREHPLAEVPPAWGDRTFWRQGMDQFELEMARIRKEKGFLPIEDRDRIKWQRDESLIQRDRQKELESFNQEVNTAKQIYEELYDFQQKWGVDVKGIMQTLRSELERAGDVVFRGGRREFRGVPSLDRLQDRLAEVAKEVREKQFKEQHDALMVPTETLLQAQNVLLGDIKESMGIIANKSDTVTQQPLSSSDIRLILKQSYDEEGNFIGQQTGGKISGPGGPMSDSIPAMLSDGEYVIRASSTSKLGTKFLDHINQYGEVPGFARGGDIPGVAKATSPYGRSQRFVNKQSLRMYERNLRDYERQNRGFDPQQFIDSWAVKDAPIETKRNLLDSFSRVSGIKIKGLTQVLEAARRAGFKLLAGGGEAGFGFGQSTIGDVPEFYRELFNVSEIERAGFDYSEFREMQEKGVAEEGAKRRVAAERFIKTKRRGFAAGGLATFLTQTQKRALLVKADELARRLSGELTLGAKGNYVSTRSRFLEQISELMTKPYVTGKLIDNFIKEWEKSTGFGSLVGLKKALVDAPRTAYDVKQPGGVKAVAPDKYTGRVLVPGIGEDAPPQEGFVPKQRTYVGVMDTIAKAAAQKPITQAEEERMNEALSRLGFYMENGVIKNYGMGGRVKRFAEGGGIGSALAPSTVRYEQQEKARQLAEAQKKQTQMYVDYLTGARTDVPNEFDTVSQDILNRVATHPDVGFTSEEIKAIQDQGFSWYDIGNTYFEAMGGLIKRGMGGMLKRKQFQAGGVVEIDPEELSFLGGIKELMNVLDIATLGPVARALVRTGTPFLPEDISAGTTAEEIDSALENKFGSISSLTRAAGRGIGEIGFGGFDPESAGEEYTLTPELSEQLAGLATDVGAQAVLFGGLTKVGSGVISSAAKTFSKASPDALLSAVEPGEELAAALREAEAFFAEPTVARTSVPETFEDFSQEFGRALRNAKAANKTGDLEKINAARDELLSISREMGEAGAARQQITNLPEYLKDRGFQNPEFWANFIESKGGATRSLDLLADNVRDLHLKLSQGVERAEASALPLSITRGKTPLVKGKATKGIELLPEEIRPSLEGIVPTVPEGETAVHELLHLVFGPEVNLKNPQYKRGLGQLIKTYREEYGIGELQKLIKNLKKNETYAKFTQTRPGELVSFVGQKALESEKIQGILTDPKYFNLEAFARGGLAGIPSFQGGGVMPEDGLAFLHGGEEVRTPEQQRAAQTLNIDAGSIQKAVEDGITTAMKNTEVKLADTEVVAKLETDTVKLDTTEITVNVETTASDDVQAFMDNNNARLSALEGETETFKIAINSNEDQMEELSLQMSALDLESTTRLWDEVESLRTDVKNVNSEVAGTLTSYENQIIALRRDLTDNVNEHTEIRGIAAQARSAAEQARAKAMNSS